MLLQRLRQSPQHGRRRHLVGAGRLPGQADGLGARVRSALAVAARRTRGAAGAECPAFRVGERRQRDPRCKRHRGSDRGNARACSRARPCRQLRCGRVSPGRSRSSGRTRPRFRAPATASRAKAEAGIARRCGERATEGELPGGSRQDRRRARALRHPQGPGRGLDRPRLAGRFRSRAARAARRRSLQRQQRHRAVSRRPCRDDRKRVVQGAGAGGGRAIRARP